MPSATRSLMPGIGSSKWGSHRFVKWKTWQLTTIPLVSFLGPFSRKDFGIRGTRQPDQPVQMESILFSELRWNFSGLSWNFCQSGAISPRNDLLTFFGFRVEIGTFFGVTLEFFAIQNELFGRLVLISFRSDGGNRSHRSALSSFMASLCCHSERSEESPSLGSDSSLRSE
jgi:hypothetical protein